MAKNNNLTDFLTDVANAIRAKKGTSALIDPQDFSDEIASISGGGGSVGEFKVEFKNLDGTLLKTEYVNSGDSVTPPANPSFDSDYLEFDFWAVSGRDSLSNITRDTLVMPQYKTKLDLNLNERPTYLFCYFGGTTSSLSPSLQFRSIPTNTYIDWGDNTIEQISTQTISHNYANSGLYVITIYGENYALGNGMTTGMFVNTGYEYCLLKAYLGEHHGSCGRTFNYCYALNYVVIPHSVGSNSTDPFYECYSLKNIVVDVTLGNNAFRDCYSLSNVVLNRNFTTLNSFYFYNCYSLKNIVLPTNTSNLQNSAFYGCRSIDNLKIPSSVGQFGSSLFLNCESLTEIIIPDITSLGTNSFSGCYSLKNIVLPNSFDLANLNLKDSPLSKECLINIANKLKDNTGTTAKSITLSSNFHRTLCNSTYLDTNGNEVPYGTTGAVSLLSFMTNKNWTVAFSALSV